MSAPASLPRWADTVSADTSRVVDPPSGKKDVGWARSERSASQHINWLFYTIYLWCNYLKNLTSEALTWTAAQVFSSTAAFPGGITGNTTSSGNITAVNLTATSAVSCATATASGAVSGASFTATGNVSAADLKYSTARERWVSAVAGSSQIDASGNPGWIRGSATADAVNVETTTGPFFTNTSVRREFDCPIAVDVGERIVEVVYDVQNDDASQTLVLELIASNGTGVTGRSSTLKTLAAAAGRNTAFSTGAITENVSTGERWWLFAQAGSGAAAGSMRVYGVAVKVIRP